MVVGFDDNLCVSLSFAFFCSSVSPNSYSKSVHFHFVVFSPLYAFTHRTSKQQPTTATSPLSVTLPVLAFTGQVLQNTCATNLTLFLILTHSHCACISVRLSHSFKLKHCIFIIILTPNSPVRQGRVCPKRFHRGSKVRFQHFSFLFFFLSF